MQKSIWIWCVANCSCGYFGMKNDRIFIDLNKEGILGIKITSIKLAIKRLYVLRDEDDKNQQYNFD